MDVQKTSQKWRYSAKTVAILDVILSVALILAYSYLVYTIAVEAELALKPENLKTAETVIHWAVVGSIILFGIFVGVEICAAMNLYVATNLKTDISQAYEDSLNWIFVHSVYVILSAIIPFATGFIWTWVLGTILRLVAMSIVVRYIVELHIVVGAAGFVFKVPSKTISSISLVKKPEMKETKTIEIVMEK